MPSLFTQTVRKLAREIPPGRVTTYGILARAAGAGGQAARSITSVLAKDPNPQGIPFHRVVYSSGRVWSSTCYDQERAKLYKKEGIVVDKKGTITTFYDILYRFGEDES